MVIYIIIITLIVWHVKNDLLSLWFLFFYDLGRSFFYDKKKKEKFNLLFFLSLFLNNINYTVLMEFDW